MGDCFGRWQGYKHNVGRLPLSSRRGFDFNPRPRPTGSGVCFPYAVGMSGWFWLIALGLFLVLIGLYLHWTVVLLGALLPFVPVVAELLRRRRR